MIARGTDRLIRGWVRHHRALIAGTAVAVAIALPALAWARPGGGESYSGGRSSSGGGSSGGGGGAVVFELVYWAIRLVFAYPAIGLPLLAIAIGYVIYSASHQHRNKDWDSGPAVELAPADDAAQADERPPAAELDELRRIDPGFSPVVFEDFAYRLFATAQRARHSAEALATVAPYVAAAARAELAARGTGRPALQVVVGAMRSYRVELPDPSQPADARVASGDPPGDAAQARRVRIGIEYEANIATAERTEYTVERWLYSRDAAATSKPPGAARKFPCPNCGAPWQAARSGTQVCASCGQAVDNGRFDWVVEQISVLATQDRPPSLTTEVPERGTDLPTYRDPEVDTAWQSLTRDDPQLSEPALTARLQMIYAQLNQAWSNADLRPVRGLVSDGLYDYLTYWVEAYRAQGLRNVLAEMRMTHTAFARVTRDRYFDAITVRIWATGKDYVVRERTGEHVRGSRHHDRAYSEYWTLIRTAHRTAAPVTTAVCSNCGAPLQIAQSGECEHCGAHLTAGEFDWVVSKIEQDDSYVG